MRDDLHVGTPLRPCWRRLLRVVPRDADFATRGPELAAVGLVEDFRRDIRDSFGPALLSAASSRQRTLEGIPEGLDRMVPTSDTERALLLHARRAAREGKSPAQVQIDAVSATLIGMGAARAREIDACTAAKHRNARDLAECRRRLAHCFSCGTADRAAQAVLAGAHTSSSPPALDLDMDLR